MTIVNNTSSPKKKLPRSNVKEVIVNDGTMTTTTIKSTSKNKVEYVYTEPSILVKIREMAKQAQIYLSHAPRHEKFALCSRILDNIYGVYEFAVETHKFTNKRNSLVKLDLANEKLRMNFKLFYELGYFHYRQSTRSSLITDADALRKFSFMSSLINEVGAMIGGWIKANDRVEENRKRPRS